MLDLFIYNIFNKIFFFDFYGLNLYLLSFYFILFIMVGRYAVEFGDKKS